MMTKPNAAFFDNLTYNYEYFYNRIQKEEISIEELYDEYRWTPADNDASDYLEAVESTIQTEMGIAEARSSGMAGEQNVNVG